MRLPWRGVVLTDPRLAEADLVGPAKLLEIPLMTIVEAALGWGGRPSEQSVIHGRHLRVTAECPEALRQFRAARVPERATRAGARVLAVACHGLAVDED